jgi:hypothetical protein
VSIPDSIFAPAEQTKRTTIIIIIIIAAATTLSLVEARNLASYYD